jgi:hypothetical protein
MTDGDRHSTMHVRPREQILDATSSVAEVDIALAYTDRPARDLEPARVGR